jgi:hypothetical protein
MTTVFVTWPFKATGRPNAAIMPDRLAHVINVKDDYGAIGNGTNDDQPAFQNAFSAAFGSVGSPHGTNTQLNRPIYIPAGNYFLSSAIFAKDVLGGYIYGDGAQATTVRCDTTAGIFSFDGCSQTLMENFTLDAGNLSTSNGQIALKLDWSGSGSVGLRDVLIRHVNTGGGQYGCRIAQTNIAGAGLGITMISQVLGNSDTGMSVEGADCAVTLFSGNTSGCNRGLWVQRGSLSSFGSQFANVVGGIQLDLQHDSATGMSLLAGGRSEAKNVAKVSTGKVVILGMSHTPGSGADSTYWSVQCDSPGTADLESCLFGSGEPATACALQGSGTYFVRNCSFHTGTPLHLASFTGKISQYSGAGIFTVATLPPAQEGLTVAVSDSNTGTWGQTPAPGPPNNHVMVRYNGTAWTVVG